MQWHTINTIPRPESDLLIKLNDGRIFTGYYYSVFSINDYRPFDMDSVDLARIAEWYYIEELN